jgi:hypothetical protein
MTSNPPSNPLPIPSNPVPSNPLIPPGVLEHPPRVGSPRRGAHPAQSILGLDPGFGGALAWLDLGGDLQRLSFPDCEVGSNDPV